MWWCGKKFTSQPHRSGFNFPVQCLDVCTDTHQLSTQSPTMLLFFTFSAQVQYYSSSSISTTRLRNPVLTICIWPSLPSQHLITHSSVFSSSIKFDNQKHQIFFPSFPHHNKLHLLYQPHFLFHYLLVDTDPCQFPPIMDFTFVVTNCTLVVISEH